MRSFYKSTAVNYWRLRVILSIMRASADTFLLLRNQIQVQASKTDWIDELTNLHIEFSELTVQLWFASKT